MSLEEIYKAFVQEHDAETEEGEKALSTADDNPEQFDAIAAGLNSAHRAGFMAGFRTAFQLAREVSA